MLHKFCSAEPHFCAFEGAVVTAYITVVVVNQSLKLLIWVKLVIQTPSIVDKQALDAWAIQFPKSLVNQEFPTRQCQEYTKNTRMGKKKKKTSIAETAKDN